MPPLRAIAALLAAIGLAACATSAQKTAAASAPGAAPGPAPVTQTPLPAQTMQPAPGQPGPAVHPVQPGPALPVTGAPTPVVAVMPPRPPSYPLPWDGSYQGQSTLVRASSPVCPRPRYGAIEIGDSTLVLPYTPNILFTTMVGADGSIHGVAGTTKLDGQIANHNLRMVISSPTCETRYDASYIWNHSWPP